MSVRKVSDKFDPKQGVGISFKCDVSYYDEKAEKWAEKTVTMTTICDDPREVMLEESTFVGLVGHARHFWVSLKVRDLYARCDDPDCDCVKRNCIHSSNRFPEETKGFTHRVKHICERDQIDYDMISGDRYTRYKKGELIDAFDSKEEARKAAIEDFKKYFGDGWVLMHRWSDEKVEY